MNLKQISETGFTGNQLKLIAMITMTLDHMGLVWFPQWWVLRLVGRLAMPIYAYMIAEGCRHTRNRKNYLLRIASLAFVCQVVYSVALRSLYMSILVTFSLSILLIYAIDDVQKKRSQSARVLALLALLGTFLICVVVPDLVPGFDVDYGLMGVLLPVLVYFGSEKTKYLTAGLILLGFSSGGLQWAALAAVPLLGMYNGQRGEKSIGKWFYLYYPLHLLVIHGIGMLL